MNFAPGKTVSGGKSPRKCIHSVPAQETTIHRAKFGWLASGERHRCSNECKTRNPLKFAGVPQTPQPISAVSCWPKLAILWRHVEDILLFNKFFTIVDTCLSCSCKDTARQSCGMVRRWRFLRHFCVLYFQRAACSTFQTCILNSH